jgi:hypothetical protein
MQDLAKCSAWLLAVGDFLLHMGRLEEITAIEKKGSRSDKRLIFSFRNTDLRASYPEKLQVSARLDSVLPYMAEQAKK